MAASSINENRLDVLFERKAGVVGAKGDFDFLRHAWHFIEPDEEAQSQGRRRCPCPQLRR